MLVYIIKRILMTLLVLLLVVVFLSLLVHIVPGDPVTMILGPRATPSLIQKMRAAMDLDKPVYVQVGHFLWNILHGSLGVDAVTSVPISSSDCSFVSRAICSSRSSPFSKGSRVAYAEVAGYWLRELLLTAKPRALLGFVVAACKSIWRGLAR